MLINHLQRHFRRPETGWDPVPAAYAESYAEASWRQPDEAVIHRLANWLGGLEGKRVLDLGGGPGQCSVMFARRGASVTWHDVSRNYLRIASERAQAAGVDVDFSLGYLEDAVRFVAQPFDLVFCQLCWYYCMDDRAFARLIYSLVKPGGAAYIDSNTPAFEGPVRGRRRLQYFLNNRLWIKVGHPHPPRGRIARLFLRYPVERMIVDYSAETNDRVFFVKKKVET